MTVHLTRHEKAALLAAFPTELKQVSPGAILATIRSLEAMNVATGHASAWSRSTPWRAQPWQLIQISAVRASHVARHLFPATIWMPLEASARILAAADRPSLGWQGLKQLRKEPAADEAQGLLARALLSAWVAMLRNHEPEEVLKDWIRRLSAVVEAESEDVGQALSWVRTHSHAQPEDLVPLLLRGELKVPQAAIEILATLSLHSFLRNPTKAEAWLNAILTGGPLPPGPKNPSTGVSHGP